MTLSIRQQLEDEMISRLQKAIGRPHSPTGYVAHIGPYNGEIDETDGPDDLRKRLRGRFPAILISSNVGLLESISVTKRNFRRTLTTEIYCLSNHMRTRENRVRADKVHEADSQRDPGIYKMVEDIADTLQGQQCLVPGAGPIMPSREDVLLQQCDFTAWRLLYDVRVDQFIKPLDFGEGDLLEIYLDGNLTDGNIAAGDDPNPIAEANSSVAAP